MNGQQSLASARFLEQAEQARAAAQNAAAANAANVLTADDEQRPAARGDWERASSWVSLGVGVLALTFVGILAVPYLNDLRTKKAPHPIDLMLRLGGADSNQTFEKFLRDSAESSKREWEERYRQSPVYQLDQKDFNWPLQSGFKPK